MAAFLIRAGRAICGHCPGIGSRPVCDCFGRRAGVGCPGGVGTGWLFAGWRIRWTRLILRGFVSTAGKKHQGDQWYDTFHSFWSFCLFDTRPVRSPYPSSWLIRSCDTCSVSAVVSCFSLVFISVAFDCRCFCLRLSAFLAGNRLAFFCAGHLLPACPALGKFRASRRNGVNCWFARQIPGGLASRMERLKPPME